MIVKCLLVDDLAENRLALAALLRAPNVEVLEARSGPEALDLLLRHDVALALVDVQMPDMDGFELAELMRGAERTRSIPIIFVTAGGRDQERMFQGYESGAVDFLYKPVDPRILANKARVFFDLYRQRAELDRQLRERTEMLRVQETFAAVLGHDLRNPLGAIVSAAELIARRAPEERTQKTAARIVTSGKRMSRLIETLLDLSRVRLGGGMPLHRSAVDLGELLGPVVQEHRSAQPAAHIDVAQSGALAGFWDGDRLAQLASNLIGNALQHGGGEVRVALDGDDPKAVVLSVENPGDIPRELVGHLFDPFRSRTGSAGLGLGLYIVQQIANVHGGSIAVASHEGRVTFRVHLPRTPAPASAPASESDAGADIDAVAGGTGRSSDVEVH